LQDYRDVEYVSVTSFGRLITDPRQGIEEDQRDNFASVSTHAYPDVPQIAESVPVPWWAIAVAVAIGIFILLLIVCACWRCGFFKRNRPDQPTLYKAEFHHTQEEWAEG
jgi:integrin alpha 7